MKRILILAAAAMGLLVASCQKVELVDNSAVENVKAYTHYLTATVEDNAETRVAFDENGAFYWNEDDVIGVVDIIDDTTSVFTEMFIEEDTTRVGTAKVRFGGELIGEMGHYTAYPYNAAHAIEGDVLTYNLPESYSVVVGENGQQINTNAAMWAKIEDGNATFKHLGGFFKIYVLNLPSSGTLTVSTFNKKLTGNFETDLTDETPVIETAEFDPYAAPSVDEEEDFTPADGNTVTVDFVVDSEDVVTEGVFYIPAPLGTYSYVQVSVTSLDPVNYIDVTTERTFTDVTIKRCTPAAGTITVTTAESQLQSALDYYDQVNLTEPISLTAPLTISKAVTLDLNGQTLSAGTFKLNNDGSYEYGDSHSVAFLIKDGGKLTIIDSSEDTTEYFESASGQVVAADAANSHIAIVEDGGELIIQAGNFSNKNNPANGDGNALIVNNGNLSIYGGVFEPCYDYNAASEFSEASYSPAYSGNGNNVIKGGEYKGFKPANNAIGIEEVTVYPSASFGEDGDIEFEFDPQVVTRYMVSFEWNKTFVAALSTFYNVPLTEDLTFTEPIKVSTYVTLNLRESTLTGQIINENGALTIESGVNGKIVNSNGSTIKTVGVETPQTKATVTVPSGIIPGLHGGLASTSINGGTFIGGATSPAVEAQNNSTLNITAGRFEGLYGILTNGSVINVSGAEFEATNGIYVENSNVTYQNCNFNDVTDADVVLGNNNTNSNINESNVTAGGNYELTPELVTEFFTEGGSLTLTDDITLTDLTLGEGKTVILDLGGKTVTLNPTNTYGIINNGDLTIQNGTITTAKNAIQNLATLNIDNVTITSTGRGIHNSGADAILTIDATMTSTAGNVIHNNGGNVTINGGKYSTSVANGATIYCDGITNGTDSAWKLTINDGTFVSEKFTAVSLQNNYWGLTSAGYANINKGTFTGSNVGASYDLYVGCATANVNFEKCTFTNNRIYVEAAPTLTPPAPAYINGEEYTVSGLVHLTPESLKTAIANGGYVHVGADMKFNDILAIPTSLTLDLHGKTLEGTKAPENSKSCFIQITKSATVTIKNGKILNKQNYGRCVETRTGNITLTLDNVNLETPIVGESQQPLTVGGSGDNITVNINKSTINTNVISGYAITTFNPVTMNITESTISGWCALNIRGASGSLGSNGSVFNVTESTLNGTNKVTEGDSNGFAVIKIEDHNVTVNVDEDSHINANATNNNEYFVSIGDPVNHDKQENDPTIKVITGTNVTFATENLTLNGAKAKFLVLDKYQTLEGNIFKFHKNFKKALNAEGYTTTEPEGDLVTVNGLAE